MKKKLNITSWFVVSAVGLLVIAIVLGCGLFDRLSAAQNLIGGLSPAFTAERVAGARAGINTLSAAVDTVDPIITEEGGASAEVGKLVNFVADNTGLAPGAVVNALNENYPKTTNLLLALPLSEVSSELPELVAFLSENLKLTPDQVMGALQENFPNLTQVIVNLPKATSGWNQVPGIKNLTRFNGDNVSTVPQVRNYFSKDVIPVLESQHANYHSLAAYKGVSYLALLLLLVGVIAAVYGVLVMIVGTATNWDAFFLTATWSIVVVVGVIVLALVFGLNLHDRLNSGQQVLDAAAPAFTAERVAGDVAAIDMVDTVVKTFDPTITQTSGAAAEVPKLVGFLATSLNVSQATVLQVLADNFPHTLHLLLALPLSEVNAEIAGSGGDPGLVQFLASVLKLPPDAVVKALQDSFPNIYQAIANLPAVVNNWNNVAGAENLTRFDGTEVKTVPQVTAYFKADVIPALAAQQANFQSSNVWPRLTVFAPLVTIIGIVVIVFGLLMLPLVRWLSRD